MTSTLASGTSRQKTPADPQYSSVDMCLEWITLPSALTVIGWPQSTTPECFSGTCPRSGRGLVTAGEGPKRGDGGTVRLWDLTAVDPARSAVVLRGRSAVICIALSDDGHWLAGAGDKEIWLWNLRLPELAALACRTSGRHLSLEEWEQYFGNVTYRKTCHDLPPDPSVLTGFIERLISLTQRDQLGLSEFKALSDEAVALDDATMLNAVCWLGSTSGFAKLVLPTGERATVLDPRNGAYRDSRGLARALTGDLQGAAEDFAYYTTWARDRLPAEKISIRQAWIESLRAGRNPFDSETLIAIRWQ